MASLESPPAGGDHNRGPALATTIIIFDVLATISVLARMYVRSRIVKQIGLDDVFIVLSLTTWIVAGAFIAFAIRHGLGRHAYYLSPTPDLSADFTQAWKWQLLTEWESAFSLLFTRISVCLFLLRIFGAVRQWRRILYCALAFITVTNIPFAIIVITECAPMRKSWDPSIHGKCVSRGVVEFAAYGSAVVSAISDWILSSLPILCMWKVQMRPRLKAGICVLMAMGFFSGICAICRTALTRALFGNDLTWDVFGYDLAGILEQDIGIVAACIPTLKPLFSSQRLAKNSARQLEDQRPLHSYLNKLTPSSAKARTAHESAGTYQVEFGPGSLIQREDVGPESLDRRGGTLEIGLVKTVDISHERNPDYVPGIWSAVSHPQDDRTDCGQA